MRVRSCVVAQSEKREGELIGKTETESFVRQREGKREKKT